MWRVHKSDSLQLKQKPCNSSCLLSGSFYVHVLAMLPDKCGQLCCSSNSIQLYLGRMQHLWARLMYKRLCLDYNTNRMLEWEKNNKLYWRGYFFWELMPINACSLQSLTCSGPMRLA